MRLVMSVATRVVVLNFGRGDRRRAAGTTCSADPAVIEAYSASRRTPTARPNADAADGRRSRHETARAGGRPRPLRRDRRDQGHQRRGRRGRDRHPARCQRRGQDDHPAHASPASCGRSPARSSSRDGAIDGLRPTRWSPWVSGTSPEGRRIFPHDERAREPRRWARTASARRAKDDLDRVFALFPRLRERRGTGGRDAVGRRAADASDRSRTDVAAAVVAARRAVDGARAAHGRSRSSTSSARSTSRAPPCLLVEQNAAQALSFAHRGYVLETGSIVMSDVASSLLVDPRVRAAYLGEGAA